MARRASDGKLVELDLVQPEFDRPAVTFVLVAHRGIENQVMRFPGITRAQKVNLAAFRRPSMSRGLPIWLRFPIVFHPVKTAPRK